MVKFVLLIIYLMLLFNVMYDKLCLDVLIFFGFFFFKLCNFIIFLCLNNVLLLKLILVFNVNILLLVVVINGLIFMIE